MEFFPMYVDEPQNREPGDIIKHTDWNNLFNLLMTQGNHNTDALLEISQTYPTIAQMDTAIAERVAEIGAGDMAKAVYDTDEDGIVDLAETVVDGGITTDKIADNAINENKLSDFLLQYIQTAYTTAIDKSRVKFGSISDLTPSSTQQGATDGHTTVNDYATYDIGFTPRAVIIFRLHEGYTADGYVTIGPVFGLRTGPANLTIQYYGGIAWGIVGSYITGNTICYGGLPGVPIWAKTQEVFRLVTGGFRIHNYSYYNTSETPRQYETIFGNSYYLAIGY